MPMKILVAVKQVASLEEDFEIRADGRDVEPDFLVRDLNEWDEYSLDVPLEFVYSPYRELARPVMTFIDELDARFENDIITVVLPEFVVRHWWGNLLHNQNALLLKGRLLFRKGTVVTSVPYHLE